MPTYILLNNQNKKLRTTEQLNIMCRSGGFFHSCGKQLNHKWISHVIRGNAQREAQVRTDSSHTPATRLLGSINKCKLWHFVGGCDGRVTSPTHGAHTFTEQTELGESEPPSTPIYTQAQVQPNGNDLFKLAADI